MTSKPWPKGFCGEACPVVIRGTAYPSQHAAAKALGVPQTAVYKALEQGSLDGVGLGRNHDKKKPVSAGGVVYESTADAARANGHRAEGVASSIRQARYRKMSTATFKGVVYEW